MAISHFVGTRATSNTKKPPLVSLKKKKKLTRNGNGFEVLKVVMDAPPSSNDLVILVVSPHNPLSSSQSKKGLTVLLHQCNSYYIIKTQ